MRFPLSFCFGILKLRFVLAISVHSMEEPTPHTLCQTRCARPDVPDPMCQTRCHRVRNGTCVLVDAPSSSQFSNAAIMTESTAEAVKSKQLELASRPDGKPERSNFRSRTVELSPIEDGQFLVKNHWMSVDPYMRGRMKAGDSYVPAFQIDQPLEGGCIGEVVQSRHSDFDEGLFVLGQLGWREYWKSDGEGVRVVDPDVAPLQAYLGVLGMTGMTAWVGLNKIAKLKRNSTVFIGLFEGSNLGKALVRVNPSST